MPFVSTDSRAAVAAELAEARAATFALLEPLSDQELARQWSPLQSPLVWDLAHIGHFEDAWIGQQVGGLPPLLAEGEELYDAFRHARDGRGELPLLDPAAARDYVFRVRDRSLAVLEETELGLADDPLLANGFVFGLVLQHERQHGETMLQTISLSGLCAPRRPSAAGRGRRATCWSRRARSASARTTPGPTTTSCPPTSARSARTGSARRR